MIAITGAAGFIASNFWAHCLAQGRQDIIAVDDFSRSDKRPNWEAKPCAERIERSHFLQWLALPQNAKKLDLIVHLGARTDTTEKDVQIFNQLNLRYSQQLFRLCSQYQIPLIYASSAATYGLGEWGYDDQIAPASLLPLNPYGHSKNDFDKWVLEQSEQPPFWAGLKFFNVYGENEYHKGRMASVVFHTYQQIQKTGAMRLFRSHRPEVGDGQQQRDFIYIKDIINIIDFLAENRSASGIYNAGTGQARSFLDLARQTFLALKREPEISFIDTPLDIRDTYQYFTEANMQKLLNLGYRRPFYSLEEGVSDYVERLVFHHQQITH